MVDFRNEFSCDQLVLNCFRLDYKPLSVLGEEQNTRGVLLMMAYTGGLRLKGVPFSGFRKMKG